MCQVRYVCYPLKAHRYIGHSSNYVHTSDVNDDELLMPSRDFHFSEKKNEPDPKL